MKSFVVRASLIGLLLVAIVAAANADTRHYHGYQVIRTQAKTKEQLDALKVLENEGLDFWKHPKLVGGFADIMVSTAKDANVYDIFRELQMDYAVLIPDVEELVGQERVRLMNQQAGNMTWNEYHRLSTIYEWLDNLVVLYSNLVSIETFGNSTEGRELKVLKISTGGSGKPAFWIDATIHAREWISTSTATYIINELVTKQSNYSDILNAMDFYFLPLVNPDGYEFSHSTDRLWRKTRSNYANYTGDCIGVDPNRNFGFKYGGDDGSSNNPCSLTYRGPNAYSEPETEALKNYINNKANSTNWSTFITLHSYSQLWMTPYGYSATELPADFLELKNLSDKAVGALTAVHNTAYITGNAAQILYESNGSSRDWAKGEGGFKFVYTIELRDTGTYGFVLPPNQIIPTAEETWAGIQVVARNLISN